MKLLYWERRYNEVVKSIEEILNIPSKINSLTVREWTERPAKMNNHSGRIEQANR